MIDEVIILDKVNKLIEINSEPCIFLSHPDEIVNFVNSLVFRVVVILLVVVDNVVLVKEHIKIYSLKIAVVIISHDGLM